MMVAQWAMFIYEDLIHIGLNRIFQGTISLAFPGAKFTFSGSALSSLAETNDPPAKSDDIYRHAPALHGAIGNITEWMNPIGACFL